MVQLIFLVKHFLLRWVKTTSSGRWNMCGSLSVVSSDASGHGAAHTHGQDSGTVPGALHVTPVHSVLRACLFAPQPHSTTRESGGCFCSPLTTWCPASRERRERPLLPPAPAGLPVLLSPGPGARSRGRVLSGALGSRASSVTGPGGLLQTACVRF